MTNIKSMIVLELWWNGRENGLRASAYSVDYITLEGSIHTDYGVKGIPGVVQYTVCTTLCSDPEQPWTLRTGSHLTVQS